MASGFELLFHLAFQLLFRLIGTIGVEISGPEFNGAQHCSFLKGPIHLWTKPSVCYHGPE